MIAQVIGAITSVIGLFYFIYYRPYRRHNTPRPVQIRLHGRQRLRTRKYARTRPPARRSSSRGLQAAGASNTSLTSETAVDDPWEDEAPGRSSGT
jgi:hypothetical protein